MAADALISDTPGGTIVTDRRRASRALQALNFFTADMQAGIGPFLGGLLQRRGWTTGPIGSVMTAGGIAGTVIGAVMTVQGIDASLSAAIGG